MRCKLLNIIWIENIDKYAVCVFSARVNVLFFDFLRGTAVGDGDGA